MEREAVVVVSDEVVAMVGKEGEVKLGDWDSGGGKVLEGEGQTVGG